MKFAEAALDISKGALNSDISKKEIIVELQQLRREGWRLNSIKSKCYGREGFYQAPSLSKVCNATIDNVDLGRFKLFIDFLRSYKRDLDEYETYIHTSLESIDGNKHPHAPSCNVIRDWFCTGSPLFYSLVDMTDTFVSVLNNRKNKNGYLTAQRCLLNNKIVCTKCRNSFDLQSLMIYTCFVNKKTSICQTCIKYYSDLIETKNGKYFSKKYTHLYKFAKEEKWRKLSNQL